MDDVKKLVKDFLIKLGIITEKFTGEIVIIINEGGVRGIFKQREKVIWLKRRVITMFDDTPAY